MEENTSMFNNKIVGVLVAVIVLATVLVPICNAFSNSGGSDNPTPLASEVWENPGSPMSEIDLSDHSKTYTWSTDDGYEDGTIIFMYYNETYYQYGWWIYDSSLNSENPFYDRYANRFVSEITLFWDTRYWTIDNLSIFEEDNPHVWIYDKDGSDWGICYTSEEYIGGKQIEDIRLSSNSLYSLCVEYAEVEIEYEYGIVYNFTNNQTEIVDTFMWEYPDDDTELEYNIIDYPVISLSNDGKITLTGSLIGEYDGNSKEFRDLNFDWVGGIIPKTVEIQSDGPTPGSDSGIAGTIIGYIPVFVAVALLGAIVTLFINKKD